MCVSVWVWMCEYRTYFLQHTQRHFANLWNLIRKGGNEESKEGRIRKRIRWPCVRSTQPPTSTFSFPFFPSLLASLLLSSSSCIDYLRHAPYRKSSKGPSAEISDVRHCQTCNQSYESLTSSLSCASYVSFHNILSLIIRSNASLRPLSPPSTVWNSHPY